MAFGWKEHSVLNLTFVIERLLVKFDQLISGFTFETSYLPFKVIPLFCTAHPLLRVILRHPRWRRLFPLVRKEQTRAAFAELKLLLAILPKNGWQLPGLQLTNKEMKKKMCVIPKSAVVLHFAAFELWNSILKCPGWGFGWGCESYGTALRLSNSVWPRIATVYMLFKLQVWRDEYLSNK